MDADMAFLIQDDIVTKDEMINQNYKLMNPQYVAEGQLKPWQRVAAELECRLEDGPLRTTIQRYMDENKIGRKEKPEDEVPLRESKKHGDDAGKGKEKVKDVVVEKKEEEEKKKKAEEQKKMEEKKKREEEKKKLKEAKAEEQKKREEKKKREEEKKKKEAEAKIEQEKAREKENKKKKKAEAKRKEEEEKKQQEREREEEENKEKGKKKISPRKSADLAIIEVSNYSCFPVCTQCVLIIWFLGWKR